MLVLFLSRGFWNTPFYFVMESLITWSANLMSDHSRSCLTHSWKVWHWWHRFPIGSDSTVLSLSDNTGVVCNSLQFFLSLACMLMLLCICTLYNNTSGFSFECWTVPALQFWDLFGADCEESMCWVYLWHGGLSEWCEIFFHPFKHQWFWEASNKAIGQFHYCSKKSAIQTLSHWMDICIHFNLWNKSQCFGVV